MGHPRYEGEESAKRGLELYEREIRAKVETEENIGKVISIDIETGDYGIDAEPIAAADKVFARHPAAVSPVYRST